MHILSQLIIKHLYAVSIFLLISGILIFSWFRFGYFYGGGDVGLQTYNPQRVLEIAKYLWWEAAAPGTPVPQGLTAIPFNFLFSFLQFLGFGPLALQASLFFLILNLMGFGMYFFLLSVVPNRISLAILGAFFYMLNPYMMISVWHRFVHTTFFMIAALPFLAIFWQKWIKTGSLLALLLFLLTNLFAVYLFGTIAFIITIWLFLTLLVFLNVVFPWQGRKAILKTSGRFFLGLAFWVLTNVWWFVPVFTIAPAQLGQQHTAEESTATLISLGRQTIIPYLLQMVNPFYLIFQKDFGQFYLSFIGKLLPWVFIIPVIIGFLYGLKEKLWAKYCLSFLLILFLSKGAASPFGHGFIWAFQNFFPLGVLRNPYEKIGVLLPFFASIVFVFGLIFIFDFFKKNLSKNLSYLAVLGIVTSILIFSYPMFTGLVLGRVDKNNFIKVPQSYILADEWVKENALREKDRGKILHLPLTRRESITYNWEKGYSGLEPSPLFFTSAPSISHGFNLHRIDDSLTALSLIFHKPYHENEAKILKLLQDFNVRFIVLHKDLDWLGGDTYHPLETEKLLNALSFVKKEAEFGDLIIYKITDEFFAPKIEINNNISLVYPQKVNMRVWPWLVSQEEKSFISEVSDDLDNNLYSSTDETLIFPENSFSYPEASASSLENTAKQLTIQLNNLLGAAQYVKQLGIIHPKTERTVKNIILASQKLMEGTIQQGSLDEYSNLMDKIFPQLDETSTLYFDIAKVTIRDILKLHEVILSVIEKQSANKVTVADVRSVTDVIRQFLIKEKTLPLFSYDEVSEVGERQVYNFSIISDGKYELILTNSKIKDAYLDKLSKLDFQINDKAVTLLGREDRDTIVFGGIDLKKGQNEISFSNPTTVNLITSASNLTKIGNVNTHEDKVEMQVSKNNPSAIESPVLLTGGEDIFQLNFDAAVPANVGLYIQIIQDTDTEQNGQKVPGISFLQHLGQVDWQGSYNIKLPPLSLTSREAKIRLIALIPPEVSNFNTTSVRISNLRLIRILNNQILLRAEGLNNGKSIAGTIDFKRKNAVEYEGNLKLTHPGFVYFKEAYHPGWELELKRGNETFKVDKHYLANLYGNAWFIEREGEYKFKIEFKPQQKVTYGLYLAGVGWLAVLLLWLGVRFNKIPWKLSE